MASALLGSWAGALAEPALTEDPLRVQAHLAGRVNHASERRAVGVKELSGLDR